MSGFSQCFSQADCGRLVSTPVQASQGFSASRPSSSSDSFAPPPSSSFGASGFRAPASTVRTEGKFSGRPSHETHCARVLSTANLIASLEPVHHCENKFRDAHGHEHQCYHQLYGTAVLQQLDTLRDEVSRFLQQSAPDRRREVYAAMRHAGGHHAKSARPLEYTITTKAAPAIRIVCRPVFRARYPVSDRTQSRLESRKRNHVGPDAPDTSESDHSSEKRMELVGWWLSYAMRKHQSKLVLSRRKRSSSSRLPITSCQKGGASRCLETVDYDLRRGRKYRFRFRAQPARATMFGWRLLFVPPKPHTVASAMVSPVAVRCSRPCPPNLKLSPPGRYHRKEHAWPALNRS